MADSNIRLLLVNFLDTMYDRHRQDRDDYYEVHVRSGMSLQRRTRTRLDYQSQKDDLLAYIRVYGIGPLVGALSTEQLSEIMQHDYGCNCIARICLRLYERDCSLTDDVSRIQAQLANDVFLDRRSFFKADMVHASLGGTNLAADDRSTGKPRTGVLTNLCSVPASP